MIFIIIIKLEANKISINFTAEVPYEPIVLLNQFGVKNYICGI